MSHGQHMCRESINKHLIMQKAPVPHTEQPCWYRCFFLVYQALNSFFRKVFLRPFIRPFGMKLHRFMWKYMKLAFEKVQRSCTFVGFCGDAWRYRNWPIHFDAKFHLLSISYVTALCACSIAQPHRFSKRREARNVSCRRGRSRFSSSRWRRRAPCRARRPSAPSPWPRASRLPPRRGRSRRLRAFSRRTRAGAAAP